MVQRLCKCACVSNFLDETSSLSHSIAFLYFFALIAEEGFMSIVLNSVSCVLMSTVLEAKLLDIIVDTHTHTHPASDAGILSRNPSGIPMGHALSLSLVQMKTH